MATNHSVASSNLAEGTLRIATAVLVAIGVATLLSDLDQAVDRHPAKGGGAWFDSGSHALDWCNGSMSDSQSDGRGSIPLSNTRLLA